MHVWKLTPKRCYDWCPFSSSALIGFLLAYEVVGCSCIRQDPSLLVIYAHIRIH